MAINFIADREENINKAKMLYEKAIKIGEEKLGKEYFTKHKGHFWGLYETRPYITAKLKYAGCIHALGDIDNAIKEYFEVIELNTNDN